MTKEMIERGTEGVRMCDEAYLEHPSIDICIHGRIGLVF